MFYVGIVALLAVLGLSLIITRVATVALSLTGLSYETARFQSRSAFTGTGFTTSESENVVGHPVRRRIVMVLMILRSAGFVTIIVSVVLSFLDAPGQKHAMLRVAYILAGIAVLWLIAISRWIERYMQKFIGWALQKWTSVDVRDYSSLLNLAGNYSVTELNVKENDWLAGKKLSTCRLREEGVLVLGVVRDDGSYVGAPKADTVIHPGNTLILYGRSEGLCELDERRADFAGDQAHERAKEDQRRRLQEQEEQEDRYFSRQNASLDQDAHE